MGSLWDGEICRSSAAIARIALIAVASCGGPARPAPQAPVANTGTQVPVPTPDPNEIVGRWTYRARLTCEHYNGDGWVEFDWDPAAGIFQITGEITWPQDPASPVRWWGTARPNPASGELDSDTRDSRGGHIFGHWVADRARPLLSIDLIWDHGDGCQGIGHAERQLDLE